MCAPPDFCADEPTTGQDAKSSALILAAMRHIANSGRTVVCTIHQPTPSSFFSFDQLLLLAPGGYQAYFGALGHHAASLQAFLESTAGATPLPLHVNPAVWMLDIIRGGNNGEPAAAVAGGGNGGEQPGSPEVDSEAKPVVAVPNDAARGIAEHYKQSHAHAHMRHMLEHAKALGLTSGATAPAPASTSLPLPETTEAPVADLARNPFFPLLQRTWVEYYRNAGYNVSRGVTVVLLAVFFGMVYYDMDLTTFSGVQSAFGAILAAPGFVGEWHLQEMQVQSTVFNIHSEFVTVRALTLHVFLLSQG